MTTNYPHLPFPKRTSGFENVDLLLSQVRPSPLLRTVDFKSTVLYIYPYKYLTSQIFHQFSFHK